MRQLIVVVFMISITGCASQLEKEFTQVYGQIKTRPGVPHCYEVYEPASIAGKYCTLRVPEPALIPSLEM